MHETWVEYIKLAGQTIVDNAESIVGSEKYLASLNVTVSLYPHEAPIINISRDFYPEGINGMDVK